MNDFSITEEKSLKKSLKDIEVQTSFDWNFSYDKSSHEKKNSKLVDFKGNILNECQEVK